MNSTMRTGLPPLADAVGFDLLRPDLGRDIESAIRSALSSGAVFAEAAEALGIFRRALANSRWSQEALAEAACGMTFRYMSKVGEFIYSDGMPKEWAEMTPAEAGENAVKMMLYYAILRCGTAREEQRAIALYNSYCFGYALGMNFRNKEGRREMLWPEDLEQNLAAGHTRSGCAVR